jgi:hypothetical protein
MGAEKLVLVGVMPQEIVIGLEDQVVWFTEAGNLKIEFDPKRCPFTSNVMQAPPGMRLLSGPPMPGTKLGFYKYRISLNDLLVGTAEVVIREK